MTVDIRTRDLGVLLGVAFGAGIAVGWYLKEVRIRYLKKKKDFYLNRLEATRKAIDAATA